MLRAMRDSDVPSSATVGCRALEVEDPIQGAQVAVRLLYPTREPEQPCPFGPFTLNLATGAGVEGDHLPLVVVSHGTGSTPWLHRDLASHLARSGFVVALIQHPGNNRGDDGLAGKLVNLQNRPRHVRLVIDAVFADEHVGKHLATGGVGVVGHSLGAYTALAVAGGKPSAFAWETPDGVPGPFAVEHDARVRALVLLAPATVWFMGEGALCEVEVPILMRTGGADVHAEPIHGQIVERGVPVPARLDHQVVPKAGHFGFVSVYPSALKSPAIPPSQDPEGFDRAAFLPVLFADVVAFLRRVRLGTDDLPTNRH
jgi:predicted dienelactone hydrolase